MCRSGPFRHPVFVGWHTGALPELGDERAAGTRGTPA
jgi:hypothetical protein